MSLSERIYRFLLRAYPRHYREGYGEPMEQLFRDRLREIRGISGLAAFWLRTLADWAVSVRAQHRAHRSPLTTPARNCLLFACAEAISFSRREITVEHLLLGILRQERSLVPAAALETVMHAIEAIEPAGRRALPMETLPLSREAKRVIANAKRAAGLRPISPADLMSAIRSETDSLAARLLTDVSESGR